MLDDDSDGEDGAKFDGQLEDQFDSSELGNRIEEFERRHGLMMMTRMMMMMMMDGDVPGFYLPP